jgi:hypothetical protein
MFTFLGFRLLGVSSLILWKLYDTINDGFGKANIQLPTKKITVEVKSLNSKGLDLNDEMPLYREMELGLRTQIALNWKEEK